MQVSFSLAGEISQVLDAIPWVRCASGNVLFVCLVFILFPKVYFYFVRFLVFILFPKIYFYFVRWLISCLVFISFFVRLFGLYFISKSIFLFCSSVCIMFVVYIIYFVIDLDSISENMFLFRWFIFFFQKYISLLFVGFYTPMSNSGPTASSSWLVHLILT